MASTRRRRSIDFPIQKLPSASPAMNDAKTVLTARTVSPNSRWSMRAHTTSYSRPLMPERKHRTRTTARQILWRRITPSPSRARWSGGRDREGERRADARLALDPDPPPMELDELPAQRQPETRPFRFPVRRADLPEFLEHRV